MRIPDIPHRTIDDVIIQSTHSRMCRVPHSAALWYESPEEVERALLLSHIRQAQVWWLHKAIHDLPSAQRYYTWLFIKTGKCPAEIARMANVTPSTVREALQRAIVNLRSIV